MKARSDVHPLRLQRLEVIAVEHKNHTQEDVAKARNFCSDQK
jgi:hypothetical protein